MSDAPENSRTLGNVLEDIEQSAAAGADTSGYIRELADMALFSAHRVEALQAENARLREALEGIWRCATAQNATDDEARGWIEVSARAALDDLARLGQEFDANPGRYKRDNDQGADQK